MFLNFIFIGFDIQFVGRNFLVNTDYLCRLSVAKSERAVYTGFGTISFKDSIVDTNSAFRDFFILSFSIFALNLSFCC